MKRKAPISTAAASAPKRRAGAAITGQQQRGEAAGDHCGGCGVAARRAQMHRSAGDAQQLQHQHRAQRHDGDHKPGRRAASPASDKKRDADRENERKYHRLISEVGQKP